MCGIAGIYHLNGTKLEKEKLRVFTDAMKHRGPDGAGYELYHNETLGLGHRRLSILDLTEAGKQPFSYLNRYHITYNGEVYNFLEIRNELQNKGYTFKTDTDTEVILAAYHEYGKDCLLKFNGMWAFAIWDEQKKELFLSRDRYGVKPLHYVYIPGQLFAFASETIAFKNLEGFRRRFNQEKLAVATQAPHVIEANGETIFEGIEQLLPGHTLTIFSGKELTIQRWWDTVDHLVNVPANYSEQIEKFKELFFDACKLRMRSDVSIASALSGGIDSSSVYCTLQQFKTDASALQRLPGSWQKAFVATFPGTPVDERQYAETVIQQTKGDAVYIEPDYSNLVNDIIQSTQLLDSIISAPIIAIADIYKAMRQHGITVSLDGHGADEYAFGYNSYVLQRFYQALNQSEEAKAKEMADTISKLSSHYTADKLMQEFYAANNLTSYFKKGVKQLLGKSNVEPSVASRLHSWFKIPVTDTIRPVFSNPFKGITSTLFDDFHYNSLPINLRDFDRAAMQHSIEIRMPFMDYRLVSFMFSLPEDSKLGGGYTKRIIRDAMKGILPEAIRTRTLKIGIAPPLVNWLQGPLKEYTLDQIHSSAFLNLDFVEHEIARKQIENHYKNHHFDANDAFQTWGLLNALLIHE